jgi:GAF domain-containing protein
LAFYHDRPYNWRDDEIILMIEAAKQIWHKLRAMQTVDAVRGAEKRLELALENY